ncbi:FkbH like protein [Segniliparus rotundus DSM 44985]|uniref:FkbH like protein n=1 Tax=Segniliparus rotundus (strain ATCC BAA-972 / CDC 1076 / CIP 108378 / DSM 44985 / JCM 13578) TaxID=640132 RepID=D6ZEG3_SEGRD|nr:HAD-IIIC family phosphatase [Segniliparus rotundus]ADG99439.1 FkbH like protein [Segniliparus rotundus DSM 44985]
MTVEPDTTARALWNSPPIEGRQALAVRFTDVVTALSEADDRAVTRTGAVLKHIETADVPPSVPTARIAVLGTSTLGPLHAPLLGALAARGIAARAEFGDFDRLIAELFDPSTPALAHDPTAVVLLPDGEAVFRRVAVPFTAASAASAVESFVNDLISAIRAFRARSAAPVVVPTLLLSPERSSLLLDLPSRAQLAAAWNRANLRLLELGEEIPGVIPVDMNQLAAHAAGPARDPRLAAYAQAQFTEPVLLGYARQTAAAVAALLGRTCKCLVLDLDGTMWGGVLADDGPLGVVSGEGRVGEAFAEVHDVARQLSSQGVVLAVASKNDDEAARAALTEHPGVRLNVADFAVIAANWDPKPGNVAGIAETLNIGLDSLVFLDDNPSERGAVRAALPQVRTIAANADDPSLSAPALLRDGVFTSLRITDEDRLRPQMYRAETERASFRQSVGAVEDYLAGLETEVTIAAAGEQDVVRLSQLTLRTNQYNLTTARLDPDAVRSVLRRPQSIVKTVRCHDKFGDHGLVGALFAQIDGDRLEIMHFAMSCRVLGRGVEAAALRAVLDEGADRGARDAVGSFVRSAKNGRAADFFRQSDFMPDGADTTDQIGTRTTFVRSLSTLPEPPQHLTVTIMKEKP